MPTTRSRRSASCDGVPGGAVYSTTHWSHVFGVVAVTNAMLPLLRKSPARIGNVSSGSAPSPSSATGLAAWQHANLLGYNSSKAALNAITLIYAGTLRGTGIRVNALSPGFCATDLNNHTGHLSADEGGAHIARQVHPARRRPDRRISQRGRRHLPVVSLIPGR